MTTNRKPFAYVNKYTGKMFYLNQQPEAATDTEVYFPLWLHPQPTAQDVDHIPNAGKITGWVKCSERIPDKNVFVLAHDDVGTVKAYICIHTGEWIRDNGDELYAVTHWMPLPALPED